MKQTSEIETEVALEISPLDYAKALDLARLGACEFSHRETRAVRTAYYAPTSPEPGTVYRLRWDPTNAFARFTCKRQVAQGEARVCTEQHTQLPVPLGVTPFYYVDDQGRLTSGAQGKSVVYQGEILVVRHDLYWCGRELELHEVLYVGPFGSPDARPMPYWMIEVEALLDPVGVPGAVEQELQEVVRNLQMAFPTAVRSTRSKYERFLEVRFPRSPGA